MIQRKKQIGLPLLLSLNYIFSHRWDKGDCRFVWERFRCVIEFVHPKEVTDSDNDKALD